MSRFSGWGDPCPSIAKPLMLPPVRGFPNQETDSEHRRTFAPGVAWRGGVGFGGDCRSRIGPGRRPRRGTGSAAGSAEQIYSRAFSRTAPALARPAEQDEPAAGLRGDQLQGLGQAPGPEGADHRRRQRHRTCGSHRLCPGRCRRRDQLPPGRGAGCPRGRLPDPRGRAQGSGHPHGHSRPRQLQAHHRARSGRAGRPRHPRQQCRLPAKQGRHLGDQRRADGPDIRDQHLCDLPPQQERHPAPEAGRRDHQHGFGEQL